MRKKWLGIVAVWAILGVIYAGPVYLEVRLEQHGHTAWRIFTWGILTWLAWAPLTPGMTWLARRYSLIGETWKHSVVVHLPAFLLMSVLHSAAATAVTLTIKPFDNMGSGPMTFWPRFLGRIQGSVGSDLLVYGAVIGVFYALDYYRKYREREFVATRLEAQLAQAQLDTLRMQLHPHFLFNTLNSVSALMHRDVAAADRMIARLSELLRLALDAGAAEEVPLSRELEFLEKYLEIEKI